MFPRDPPVPSSPVLGLEVLGFYLGARVFSLRSSCLRGTDLTSWVLSLAPRLNPSDEEGCCVCLSKYWQEELNSWCHHGKRRWHEKPCGMDECPSQDRSRGSRFVADAGFWVHTQCVCAACVCPICAIITASQKDWDTWGTDRRTLLSSLYKICRMLRNKSV